MLLRIKLLYFMRVIILPLYSAYGKISPHTFLFIRMQQHLKDGLLIALGICSATLGLKGFLLPAHLVDGGATGISLLLAQLVPIPLPLLLVFVNAPFIVLAYRMIGRSFSIKAGIGIIILSAMVGVVQLPAITNDKLLIAVFGGCFLGIGIGLSMRGGSVIDGTEVMAIFISRRTGWTIGDVILCVNIIIFGVAAYMLSVEIAMYSILTYLSASKMVDFLIDGIEEYTGVTIISSSSEDIRVAITSELGAGVTIYKGSRGFARHGDARDDLEILYTVITRLEIHKLYRVLHAIDPQAFVIMQSIRDTKGGVIRKRAVGH